MSFLILTHLAISHSLQLNICVTIVTQISWKSSLTNTKKQIIIKILMTFITIQTVGKKLLSMCGLVADKYFYQSREEETVLFLYATIDTTPHMNIIQYIFLPWICLQDCIFHVIWINSLGHTEIIFFFLSLLHSISYNSLHYMCSLMSKY